MAPHKAQDGFVYVMNGDCSFCIGHFIEFLAEMKQANCTLPVYVIVEDDNKEQVEYNLSKIPKPLMGNVEVVANTNGRLICKNIDNYDLNGIVFYYSQNQVENVSCMSEKSSIELPQ